MDEYWDFQCCKYGLYECPCEQSQMCVEHCDATITCGGTYYDEIEEYYEELSEEEMEDTWELMDRYYDSL